MDKLFDPRTTHDDNIYYVGRYQNKHDTPRAIEFLNNRNESVIKAGASMYYLVVDSASIPQTTIPIFYFNNTVENKQPYWVDIGAGKVYLKFIDYGDLENNISAQSPSVNETEGKIYQIEQFLEMVTVAVGAKIFTYESDKKKFAFDNSALGNDVIVSVRLYEMLGGIAKFLSYENGYAMTTVTAKVVQQVSTEWAWSDVERIYLYSATLPITQEHFSNKTSSGSDEKYKVLTDFYPLIDTDSSIDRTPFTYASDTPKLIDMRSDIDINALSFTASYLRHDGVIKRIQAAPGEVAYVKLRFVKRALFNNEYNLTKLTERIEQKPLSIYHRR